MCYLRIDPPRARTDLEPAFALFQQAGEVLGQALTAAAINEAHRVEWVDYRRLDPWIATLEDLLSGADLTLPSPNTELALQAGLFTAIVLRQTHREDIPVLATRLANLLRDDLDPNYKLLAARGIFVYSAYSGDFVLTEEVVRCTESAFNAPAATVLNRAWYAARLGFALRYFNGRREQARRWFAKAREIVREHGLAFVEVPIAIYWAWAEETFGDKDDYIERELGIAEAHYNPKSGFETVFRQMGLAFLLARRKDLASASAHMRETHAFMKRSGYTLGELAAFTGLTGILLRGADIQGAVTSLTEALSKWFPGPLRTYAENVYGAAIALEGGDDHDAVRDKLQTAFALGSRHALENALSEQFFHSVSAQLCTYALKNDIEAEHVKRVIKAQRLSPPTLDIDVWPWPVRVYLFGRFALEINELPVHFDRKAPKKPLEMLKLLASTSSAAADSTWVSEQLWPDSDTLAVRTTQSRLPKLLVFDGAVPMHENRLSLDSTLVWTDVAAFERCVEQCLAALKACADCEEIAQRSEQLLALYQGDLLKGELEMPWLITARDRLRSKFLRVTKQLGHYWEQRAAWNTAQQLYERLLEIDNVAEDIYRRLMHCHMQAGQPAEARRIYQRCRELLLRMLDVAPNAETEAMFREMDQGQ